MLDFRSEIDGEIVKVRSDSLYFYQTSRVDEPRVTPLMFDSAWVGTRPSSKNDESQHFAMDEVIKNPHLERAFINRLYSNLSSP